MGFANPADHRLPPAPKECSLCSFLQCVDRGVCVSKRGCSGAGPGNIFSWGRLVWGERAPSGLASTRESRGPAGQAPAAPSAPGGSEGRKAGVVVRPVRQTWCLAGLRDAIPVVGPQLSASVQSQQRILLGFMFSYLLHPLGPCHGPWLPPESAR